MDNENIRLRNERAALKGEIQSYLKDKKDM